LGLPEQIDEIEAQSSIYYSVYMSVVWDEMMGLSQSF